MTTANRKKVGNTICSSDESMSEKKYMDYLETRFLELAKESGVSFEKVEPGQGKVIIKENGVILGELGDIPDIRNGGEFNEEICTDD